MHNITDIELLKIQECMMKMYLDIKYVCDKYNLTIFLGGGSALGGIRHKGFIPWDDDMDLNMKRGDYEKLISVLKEELGNEYDFSAPNSSCVDTPYLKIYKKDTYFPEVFSNMTYTEIWIDVFPIDYAPKTKIMQKVKGIISDLLYFISVSTYIYQNKNEDVAEAYTRNWRRSIRYYIGLLIGLIIRADYRYLYNLFNEFITCKCPTKTMTVATGRNKYYGECLSMDDIFPPRKINFNGEEANVYHNVEKYLTRLYGDYMTIPPIEKREHHFIKGIKINEDIKWKTENAKKFRLVK